MTSIDDTPDIEKFLQKQQMMLQNIRKSSDQQEQVRQRLRTTYEAELGKLNDTITTLQHSEKAARSELEKRNKQFQELAKMHEEFVKHFDTLNHEHEELKALTEEGTLSSKKEKEYLQKIKDYESKMKHLKGIYVQDQLEKQKMEDELKQKKDLINLLKKTVSEMEKKVKSAAKSKQDPDVLNQIATLEKTNEDLRGKISSYSLTVEKLQKQIMVLLEENRQLKTRPVAPVSKDNRVPPPTTHATVKSRSVPTPVEQEEVNYTGIRRTKSCYMLR